MEKDSLRLPKVGDIWKDYHGHFIVTEEHELFDWDRRDGYVCSITAVSLDNNYGTTTNWILTPSVIEQMDFIA